MSSNTTSTTAMVLEANRVRDTMSFTNILESDAKVAPETIIEAPATVPVTVAPTTPIQALKAEDEEQLASPDAMALESPVTNPEDGLDDTPDAAGVDVPDEDREFICMNDAESRCMTGQYTLDLSRKVISDHFGRNKACTRDITDWPLFCRKHYQRATYNKKQWQQRKLELIHRQFEVIENQFPGTTYDVLFKRSEETRLSEYSRKIAAGLPEEDAKAAVVPIKGKHFEAPIDILRELYLETGKDKTHEECKNITELIWKMLLDDSTDHVPAIEFLPKLPNKVATPKTPPSKKQRTPRTPSSARRTPSRATPNGTPTRVVSTGTPGRVTSKGSVKKPFKTDQVSV